MAQIKETKNYDLFDLHSFNRDIEKIKKLEASMREYGWIDGLPAYAVRDVSGNLSIKVGHHRCCAAKNIGIGIKYVECNDGGISIQRLEETTRPWTLGDFLTSYCHTGNADYLLVKHLSEESGIPLGPTLAMLMGHSASTNTYQKLVRSGGYKIKDRKHFDAVAAIIQHFCNSGVEGWNNRNLIYAVSKLLFVKQFDPEVLKRRITKNPQQLKRQVSVKDYLQNIEAIYNRFSSEKVNLAFLADEAAKLRSKKKSTAPTMRNARKKEGESTYRPYLLKERQEAAEV